MYNLLVALAENPELVPLDPDMLCSKLTNLAKFFDPKFILDKPYDCRVVNAEKAFEQFLMAYNPYDEQQDACDFLCLMLDSCHEEMKNYYV
jgi:hypothetical protein